MITFLIIWFALGIIALLLSQLSSDRKQARKDFILLFKGKRLRLKIFSFILLYALLPIVLFTTIVGYVKIK